MTDRQVLEKLALELCSENIYYDIADNLDITTDDELDAIIKANGDYTKEYKLIKGLHNDRI